MVPNEPENGVIVRVICQMRLPGRFIFSLLPVEYGAYEASLWTTRFIHSGVMGGVVSMADVGAQTSSGPIHTRSAFGLSFKTCFRTSLLNSRLDTRESLGRSIKNPEGNRDKKERLYSRMLNLPAVRYRITIDPCPVGTVRVALRGDAPSPVWPCCWGVRCRVVALWNCHATFRRCR